MKKILAILAIMSMLLTACADKSINPKLNENETYEKIVEDDDEYINTVDRYEGEYAVVEIYNINTKQISHIDVLIDDLDEYNITDDPIRKQHILELQDKLFE